MPSLFMFVSTGKIPFIHVGNQVVSELGPIVQFTKAKASVVQMKAVCFFWQICF